ncbi:DUF6907 domain-containing protein [Kitasatospora cineracea]
MNAKTVVIRLSDGGTATAAEPDWCRGEHDVVDALADVLHDGQEIVARIHLRGRTFEALQASLTQQPFASDPAARRPYVSALIDGVWVRLDAGEVLEVAAALEAHAGRLRALGGELAGLGRT